MTYKFAVIKTTNPKPKPDESTLEFGTTFTDHMFIMDYNSKEGWHNGQVVPYGKLLLDPATSVFHYGQEMFEGLKAYRDHQDTEKVYLFRPEMNARRTNATNQRMCMPQISEELYVAAVKTVVDVDRDWVPSYAGTSLYIRPFMIATDVDLEVRASDSYKFIIVLSPVGPYYKSGFGPTKIYVEQKYVRAVVGGTGFAKVGGNYVASLKAQVDAKEKNYYQVLWLDGVDRKYVEEVGTSNAFFVINGEVITSPLTGSILPGITRDSSINLLKSWGVKVSERKLSIQEVYDAHAAGKLDEAFATGTAAIISPVGELCWEDKVITLSDFKVGPLAQRLYDTITGIQTGKMNDDFNWTAEV